MFKFQIADSVNVPDLLHALASESLLFIDVPGQGIVLVPVPSASALAEVSAANISTVAIAELAKLAGETP